MKQRTLAHEVSIKGSALHTGDPVTLTMKPAPANHGILFRRIDLHGSPELRPRVDQVTDLVRATTIQSGHAKIHTVEHVLAALAGYGIDNAVVELDANEPPIADGSSREFCKIIQAAGIMPQDEKREVYTPVEPIEFKIGETIMVEGFRAKDGSDNASGGRVTFPDGRNVLTAGPQDRVPPQSTPSKQ